MFSFYIFLNSTILEYSANYLQGVILYAELYYDLSEDRRTKGMFMRSTPMMCGLEQI